MCALVESGKRVDIPRRTVELLLTEKLGLAKEETIEKHLRLMVELGYLKMSLSPPHGAAPPRAWVGKEGMMRYDLVEKKLRAIRSGQERLVDFEEVKRARAAFRKG